MGELDGGVVFEVIYEGADGTMAGPGTAFGVGSAAAFGAGAIHHLDGYAAMEGDGGSGVDFGFQ